MSIKLSPRNLFFVVLAACVLVAGLWYSLRFQARQAQISDLSGQLDTLNSQVVQLRAAQAGLPALRQTVEKLKVDQADFLAALPQTANFGSVLDELRVTTAATGAQLTNFAVATGNVAGLPSGVRPIGLNVTVQGRFSQLFQTLRAIETTGRFTTVNSVVLNVPQASSLDPELDGTLGLTVYTYDPAQAGSSAGSSAAPQAPTAPPSSTPSSGGVQ